MSARIQSTRLHAMAHHIDVSLKSLFLHEGDGIIRRLLFGGKVIEHLATEQPQVSNHRADTVVRIEDGSLRHVELQADNEAGFGLRMLEYYVYFVRALQQHIFQTVLYLGREPLRLETGYTSPSMSFEFRIINVRELDAEPLMASDDWADNVLAILARGDREKALDVALSRLSAMNGEDRAWASATLVLLSGILGIEETVGERIKEAGMIDLMENKVLGPLFLKQIELGEQRGRSEGMHDMLHELLTEKFGPLTPWAAQRLQAATAEDLHAWAKRVLHGVTLEDTLR